MDRVIDGCRVADGDVGADERVGVRQGARIEPAGLGWEVLSAVVVVVVVEGRQPSEWRTAAEASREVYACLSRCWSSTPAGRDALVPELLSSCLRVFEAATA